MKESDAADKAYDAVLITCAEAVQKLPLSVRADFASRLACLKNETNGLHLWHMRPAEQYQCALCEEWTVADFDGQPLDAHRELWAVEVAD